MKIAKWSVCLSFLRIKDYSNNIKLTKNTLYQDKRKCTKYIKIFKYGVSNITIRQTVKIAERCLGHPVHFLNFYSLIFIHCDQNVILSLKAFFIKNICNTFIETVFILLNNLYLIFILFI